MIRALEDRDHEELLGVWLRASRVAHPFLSEDFLRQEEGKIVAEHLPAAETWVWIQDARVAGFLSLLGADVGGLFVEPDLHGRGIGRALVDHAVAIRGSLTVEVFEDNDLGRGFYQRYGFVRVGSRLDAETGLRVLQLRYSAD